MNQMNFVVASFVITGAGLIWIAVSSYFAMRRSEALADDLRNNR